MDSALEGCCLEHSVDPSLASARNFRTMLEALARPGSILTLPVTPDAPKPLTPGLAALCLVLADMDAPLWLDPSAGPVCEAWLRFNCGCPLTLNPAESALACVLEPAGMPPLRSFAQGDPEYPDRSTTLFLCVPGLGEGSCAGSEEGRTDGLAGSGRVRLAGPGIRRQRTLLVSGLPGDFWEQWRDNGAGYPLGVDVFLVCGGRIVGLPRSVRAEVL
jgi:alpha-D-ribose 1-methylphosphonate 5-triphosphate synthase subunit PhnH